MATMHEAVAARGAAGLHLGVNQRNTRALGFYRHLGYRSLHEDAITATLGITF